MGTIVAQMGHYYRKRPIKVNFSFMTNILETNEKFFSRKLYA